MVFRTTNRAFLHHVVDPTHWVESAVFQFGITDPITLRAVGLGVGHIAALVTVDAEALLTVTTVARGIVSSGRHGMDEDPIVGMNLEGA